MPFNVVGSDDAVLAVAVEIEAERARDPSYPWTIELHGIEGPVLFGDDDGISERHHRSLIELTKPHSAVVVVTGEVVRDDDTGIVISADLIRYSKGRRRIVASVRVDDADRNEKMVKMIRTSLRYDRPERV
jgi:hypothetical protein